MSTPATNQTLPQWEMQMLLDTTGVSQPRLALRTGTRIDTGRWLGRSRLWLCVTDEEIVLLAGVKRRFLERASLADCRDSTYSHPTGQLLLHPAERLRFKKLALPPTQALRVIRLIEAAQQQTPSSNANSTENSLA